MNEITIKQNVMNIKNKAYFIIKYIEPFFLLNKLQ